MKLVKNKRIGKVLFIVEGGQHEFSLLKKIFGDILEYKRIEKRRNKPTYYVSRNDSHSVVAIVNTKTSNIESINEKEYLDAIYTELIEKYSFDVTNASVYYIFDRDPESNTNQNLISELITSLKNSRENEDNMMGGMLILSYPSIEAYEISHFIEKSYMTKARLGSDVKAMIAKNAKVISMNKISDETILHACKELKSCLEENHINFDVDEFPEVNEQIFNEEEKFFENNNAYFLLSMMSWVLMDLGILRGEQEE